MAANIIEQVKKKPILLAIGGGIIIGAIFLLSKKGSGTTAIYPEGVQGGGGGGSDLPTQTPTPTPTPTPNPDPTPDPIGDGGNGGTGNPGPTPTPTPTPVPVPPPARPILDWLSGGVIGGIRQNLQNIGKAFPTPTQAQLAANAASAIPGTKIVGNAILTPSGLDVGPNANTTIQNALNGGLYQNGVQIRNNVNDATLQDIANLFYRGDLTAAQNAVNNISKSNAANAAYAAAIPTSGAGASNPFFSQISSGGQANAMIVEAQQKKGSALTNDEINAIRQKAGVFS